MSELNSLLDGSLDDLADMPTFEPYPDGTHKCIIKFEVKKINNKDAVELLLVAIETIELANPAEDTPLVKGAETSVLFMLENEFGQGSFKEIVNPLGKALGITSPRAVMEAVNGAEAEVTTKKRWNKDKTQAYTSVKSLNLV